MRVEERSTSVTAYVQASSSREVDIDIEAEPFTMSQAQKQTISAGEISEMVLRHKERLIWQDRIEPPRRYFDN